MDQAANKWYDTWLQRLMADREAQEKEDRAAAKEYEERQLLTAATGETDEYQVASQEERKRRNETRELIESAFADLDFGSMEEAA
jgi:hypothetical protein